MKLANLKNFVLGILLIATSLASASGGVSGGGGGTLPSNPVSTYFIENVIREAKRDLRAFVKYEMLFYYVKTNNPLDKKLYGGTKTMWDVLENTEIDLRETEPCYDANKKEVDGSIHSKKANHICISSFRIAPKLIQQNARIETLALILHELAHLLGADEDEATFYQQMAVHHLNQSTDLTTKNIFSAIQAEALNISKALRNLSLTVDSLNTEFIVQDLITIGSSLTKYDQLATEPPFSAYDRKEKDYRRVQETRLMIAGWSIDPTDTYGQHQLNKIFKGQKTITYSQFEDEFYRSSTRNTYGNEVMTRTDSKEDLKILLNKLSEYYMDEYSRMFALLQNQNLDRPNLPKVKSQKNPWENFIGKYEIANRTCKVSSFDSLKGIEIYNREDGRLEFRHLITNGWFDMGGLYDGAGDVLGGSTVTVYGDFNQATRRARLTTGYLGQHSTTEYTLKRIGSDEYILNVHSVRNGSYTDHTADDFVTDCNFNLEKK